MLLIENALKVSKREDKGMCKIIDEIVRRERKESNIETALRMIAKNKFSDEEIAESSGLSGDEVNELINNQAV